MLDFSGIVLDGAIYGFVALGIACTIFWGRAADLTPEASFTSGAVAAWLITAAGFTGPSLICAGIVGGGLAGLATFLITRFKIQPLLASIIVVGLAYSVHWALMGRPLQSIPSTASPLLLGQDWRNAVIAATLVIFTGALLVLFAGTHMGLHLRATAENPLCVPNARFWEPISAAVFLILGNALVGAAGALFASRAYFVEINMGVGMLISGLGAGLLGWSLFRFSSKPVALVAGALIGSFVLRAILSIALTSDLSAQWFRAVAAVAGV